VETVKGYHGEWNMGSPGGWEYQRIAQLLGKMAWDMVMESVAVGISLDFEHPQINAVPGFARMMLQVHRNRQGRNPVHAVLLAERETLDVVLENKNFVDYLAILDGVKASLAAPEHLTLKTGRVYCKGEEATVIFMDFNSNTLLKIGKEVDIEPIREAMRQGILVNPRGMEPLGAKGLFEAITGRCRHELSNDTIKHTPWTRRFYARSTSGPRGETIEDLAGWVEMNWGGVVLKPIHGYSGHGIFVGYKEEDPGKCIHAALDAGDYIVQELIPLGLWSEESTWPCPEEQDLVLKEWQTDFRCFITDEGLQGFLARFGGVPTNVGSGGGIQPLGVLKDDITPREAVDKINGSLDKLGYQGFVQIQEEVNKRAVDLGFTYLLGPIMITLRPRILTTDHLEDLRRYARNLWRDAVALEGFWRQGELDEFAGISEDEKELALDQPWEGSPALMVSDGLFSLGADLMAKE
jgi:hypothetical protein